MRSIAIMNQKGGVGKTTTAVNVSAALAAGGFKVMLIDLDPQAHATLHFGIDTQAEGTSVYDVLIGKLKIRDVRQEVADNLFLIPAHLDMVGAEIELASAVGREIILRDEILEDDMTFDYLIIDCPPSLGLFTLNALTSVNEVFVPLQPHYFSLHGLTRLFDTLEVVARRLNKNLKLSGILLTMFDHTVMSAEVAENVVSFFSNRERLPKVCADAYLFKTKIRKNVKLTEAPSHGKPIFGYDNHSTGAEDYRSLAAEIIGQNK
ncbi:chromosome partitioning protein ParA [Planctomycetales bacterium]|nr:chromosome partitioning protein ParA [Planctomycetales bacterium]